MRHFIIVKLKAPKEKEALAAPVKALFDQTLAIPGIHEVKLHLSCSERSNRYDMMIEIIMEPEALAAYDVSEPHRRWKQEYGSHIEAKAIFDCE